MHPRRVTLSGYYGFGNAGDEAVLAGLVQSLRARRPLDELDIVALSIHPQETRRTHPISAAHRYQVRSLLRALSRTDLLLSGGGSLLQDVTSAHGVFYYLGVVRLAQMLGKKTMFIAQGVGPLLRPRSRRLVASVANRLDAITVRDPQSAALLREVGVTNSVAVTADPALLLSPARPIPPEQGNDRFAMALRPWPGQESLAATVADACRRSLPQAQALLLAMQPGADTAAAEQFAANWHQGSRNQAAMPLASLQENLAACGMMVGMRLHALILAAACGVPSVALAYDPKVAAFMEQSGQGEAVYDLSSNHPDALAALLAHIWAERSERAAALRQRLPALRAAAERNAEIALALLPG